MSYQDQFELLVSPQDYKKLQEKAQNLGEQKVQLQKQNDILKDKILNIKQERDLFQQKNKQLQSNNLYLSQNGLKLARKLIELEVNNEELQVSCTQKELHFATEYKQSLNANKKLQNQHQLLLNQLNKSKTQLTALKQQMSRMLNKQKWSTGNQTMIIQSYDVQTQTNEVLFFDENEQNCLLTRQKQLIHNLQKNQQTILLLKEESNGLKNKINSLNEQNVCYMETNNDLVNKLFESSSKIKEQRQKYSQLQKQLIVLKESVWNAEDFVKAKQNQLQNNFNSQLASQKQSQQKLRSIYEDLKLSDQKLRQQNKQILQQLLIIKQQYQKLHHQNNELTDQKLRLNKSQKQSRRQLIYYQQQSKQLSQNLQQLSTQIKQKQKAIQIQIHKNTQLQHQIKQITQKNQSKLQQITSQNTMLIDKLKLSQTDIQALKNQNADQQSKVQKMDKQVKALTQQNKQMQARIFQLNSKINQQNAQIKKCDEVHSENMENLQRQYDKIIEDMQMVENQFKEKLFEYQTQLKYNRSNKNIQKYEIGQSHINLEDVAKIINDFMQQTFQNLVSFNLDPRQTKQILSQQKMSIETVVTDKMKKLSGLLANKKPQKNKKQNGKQ